MANAYSYSNVATQQTLSGSISSGAVSVTVSATTGFPGSFPYVLALDYGAATEELVRVDSAAGTTLTVVRGFGGTSAQSHSVGAVVRHVVNAQDLTDFRTHEAATGAVHGLAGSIVGTSDTQTLSNKTLTSPTVNGGALSGTFTGAPTFSGAVTLSGGGSVSGTFTGSPTFSGTQTYTGFRQTTRTNATDNALGSNITGDTNNRWNVTCGGEQSWGSGTAVRDVKLYRNAAAQLRTDGSLIADGDLTSNNLTVANLATINSLNVTNLTPGSTSVSSGSLLAASTGWSISALSVAVLKGGMLTVNANFTRSGGNITVDAAGVLSTGIVQMGTINAVYQPNSALGVLYSHAGNSIATGTARIGAAGIVELVRWQASQTIATGNIVSMTITYPL
jgi:hypothetical protein